MKKLTAPAVYLSFAVPIFILTVFTWSLYDRILGLRGILEASVIFLAITTATFYLGNLLVQKMERGAKPALTDHFRQSSLCYIAFIFLGTKALSWWRRYPLSQCETDCHGYALVALAVLIPLAGIVVNAWYVFRGSKTKAM